MMFSVSIGFSQEEDNLLACEILLLETSFSAVKVFNRVAFLEPSFERLEYDRIDLPILITANTIRDFSMLDADVRHNGDRFVVVLQITKRRPIVVGLSERDGDKKNQDLEHRGNVKLVRQDYKIEQDLQDLSCQS